MLSGFRSRHAFPLVNRLQRVSTGDFDDLSCQPAGLLRCQKDDSISNIFWLANPPKWDGGNQLCLEGRRDVAGLHWISATVFTVMPSGSTSIAMLRVNAAITALLAP